MDNRKKLLILAGAGVHCKVVDAAHEMGIYTIVTDYLQDSPAKQISDESLMFDIFDVENLINYCIEYKVNGVLAFCIDPAQKPARKIASVLGLPVFGNEYQYNILTNKKAFKEFCIKNGVDVIPEYTVDDVYSGNIEYPVIVKPSDSRASRGVSVCYDKNEVLEAIDLAKIEDSNSNFIIEKCMSNHQDLTISYIVKDGEPILISIGDRYSGREEDNLSRQLICTIQPSRFVKMYEDNVNEKVIGMIKNLGIKNGPVFMQGFVDGLTVRMYDPGIRLPGNEYERIFTKATGLNPMKSVIEFVMGGKINDFNGRLYGSHLLNGGRAIQYMINVGPGEISCFEGLEAVKNLKNVIDVQQKHFVGDLIESTGDIKHRAGEVSILVSNNIDEMIETIMNVQKCLKVLDKNGNNMLISPFDAQCIRDLY